MVQRCNVINVKVTIILVVQDLVNQLIFLPLCGIAINATKTYSPLIISLLNKLQIFLLTLCILISTLTKSVQCIALLIITHLKLKTYVMSVLKKLTVLIHLYHAQHVSALSTCHVLNWQKNFLMILNVVPMSGSALLVVVTNIC